MAQKITYNIDVNPGNSVQTLGQLENELAQINEELKGVDLNSQAFEDLSKQSQALTRELEKANLAVQGVTDEDRIRGFQGGIDIVAGSINTLTGAVGLLGLESEEFEKYTAYAANAIAFSEGIRLMAQGAVDLRESLKKATFAQNLFNASVLKNPYVIAAAAIIATLTAVLAFSKDIRIALGLQAEEAEDLTGELEAQLEAEESILKTLKLEAGLVEAQGENTEEVNKKVLQQLEYQIGITEQLLLQQEIQLEAEREANKQVTFAERLGQLWGAVTGGVTGYATALAESLSAEDESTRELSARLQATREKLLSLRIEAANTSKKIVNDRQVDTVSAIKTTNEFAGRQADAFKNANEITVASNEDLKKSLEQKKKDYIQSIRDQNAADEARMQVLGAAASALGGLGAALGQKTAVGKAAAIADIALTTGLGFANALNIAQESAKGTGPAAAFAFPIFYATQIAAVLNAIGQAKEIISGVQGGPAVPVVNVGTGGTTTSFAGPPQQPTDFGVSPETMGTASPIRAYVVSGDVTTSQEADAKLNAKRTLGS